MKDDVNARQVGIGCLSIILMGIVIAVDMPIFFKLLFLALLFIVGAIFTGATND